MESQYNAYIQLGLYQLVTHFECCKSCYPQSNQSCTHHHLCQACLQEVWEAVFISERWHQQWECALEMAMEKCSHWRLVNYRGRVFSPQHYRVKDAFPCFS